MLEIPKNLNKTELWDFISENFAELESQKVGQSKEADPFTCGGFVQSKKDSTKTTSNISNSTILVKAAISTSGLLDSHNDLHLYKMWDDDLANKIDRAHLQEHRWSLKDIISDGNDLDIETKLIPFNELGYEVKGDAEVLVFNSKVRKDRNEFMHDRYVKGYVPNHSAGMVYRKVTLAAKEGNSDQVAAWNEFIGKVINKDLAEKRGYFYAIEKAGVREGSAVARGSNYLTPTLSVSSKELKGGNNPFPEERNEEVKSFINYLK